MQTRQWKVHNYRKQARAPVVAMHGGLSLLVHGGMRLSNPPLTIDNPPWLRPWKQGWVPCPRV